MGYLVLFILTIWVIWCLCTSIIDRIRNAIEDSAIQKLRVKEDIEASAQSINSGIEQQLIDLRSSVSSFREMAYHSLPGIKDRIERNNRKQDYIRNVLPYKKNKVRYKRRKY